LFEKENWRICEKKKGWRVGHLEGRNRDVWVWVCVLEKEIWMVEERDTEARN
jgi:hypothetical protein